MMNEKYARILFLKPLYSWKLPWKLFCEKLSKNFKGSLEKFSQRVSEFKKRILIKQLQARPIGKLKFNSADNDQQKFLLWQTFE